MMHRALLLVAGLTLILPPGARAAVRYVVASSANFGNTPAAPYTTPQTAAFVVDSAMTVSADGDTIKVAGRAPLGLAYPGQIALRSGVALVGGYSLEGTPFATRDPARTLSVLDGDSEGTVISVNRGASPSTLVDGFLIIEGFAMRGGGIVANGAGVTIRRNVFYLNASTQEGAGAIRLAEESNARIIGNTFVQNTSPRSGTIQVVNSSAEIVNNIFYQDFAGYGVRCEGSSTTSIRYNDFFDNRLGTIDGCALAESSLADSGNVTVDPLLCNIDASAFTLFDESKVIGAGEGGATIGAADAGCHARVKFVSLSGAAVYPYVSALGAARSLEEVFPLTNPGDTVRVAAGEYAGRITVPPGVIVEGSWNATFVGRRSGGEVSVLTDTTGSGPIVTFSPDAGVGATLDGFVVTGGRGTSQGSAILVSNASPTLRSLSVVLNAATTDGGGVIFVNGGSPEIVNTLVALNKGSGVACAGGASPDIHHSGFFGNSGGARSGCPGTLPSNVLSSDPLFCDASSCTATAEGFACAYADADLHLFAESPYRTAGDDDVFIGALTIACNRAIHYVSTTGADRFPYATVADAARRIGDAIAVATPGDTVRVASGTYDEVVQLAPEIVIEGGWSGAFETRDPAANVTTIAASIPGSASVLAQGLDILVTAAISGFTITHASGVDGPGVEVRDGAAPLIEGNLIRGNTTSREAAGVLIDGAPPTIRHNTIYQNISTSSSERRAAGIHLKNLDRFTTLSVTRNIIYDNDGGYGISCDITDLEGIPRASVTGNLVFANEGVPDRGNPDISVIDCPDIFDFTAIRDPLFCDYDAGDITICSNSPANISPCGDVVIGARGVGCICATHTFYVKSGNSDSRFPYSSGDCAARNYPELADLVSPGDTVLFSSGNYPEPVEIVPRVTYLGNFTTEFGARDAQTTLTGQQQRRVLLFPSGVDSTTIVDGFTIASGSADRGGGVYVSSGASPLLRNIRFNRNQADSAGACIYAAPGSAPKIRFCFFKQNRVPVPKVSLVTLDNSSAEISNCTFQDNLTIAIDILSGSPSVFNNIAVRNDRGGIRCGPSATPDLGQNNAYNNDDFNYFGCPDSLLAFNLEEDPLFCKEAADNLNLFDHSPSAGTGRGGLNMGSFPIGCHTPRHFVSASGDEVFPFVCPDRASSSLQEVILLASRNVFDPGNSTLHDTVFVAGGIYDEDITIPPNVFILGGFPPDFGAADGGCLTFIHDVPGLRDPLRYPVIVRGSGTRSVAIVDGGATINNSLVDGLTFLGGFAERGGGLFFNQGSSTLFQNCTIDSCAASVAGGGVYVSTGSAPTMDFISALRNAAPAGAAVYVDSAGAGKFRKWTIAENSALPGGSVVELKFSGITTPPVPPAPEFTFNIIAFNDGIGLAALNTTPQVPAPDKLMSILFWENSGGDTLGLVPRPTFRFGDPRFCDRAGGDYRIYYKSPAVLRPCARTDIGLAETVGRFPVGCTDPGHVFLASVTGESQFPFSCPAAAARVVSDAIARAQAGDTVRVAAGLYTDNMVMSSRLVLEGGWSTSPAFGVRNPAVFRSRIVPATTGPLLRVESPKDNFGDVIPELVIDSTAVVDGLVFENADAVLENGGAVLCVDASPRISNNLMRNNQTQNFGGGICAIRSKNQPIRGNTLFENRAGHGGGIYLGDCESPIVSENIVISNAAGLRGGGIRLSQHSGAALVHDNTIANNRGEGLSFAGGSSASQIYNNVIAFNTKVGLERYPAPDGEPVPAQDHNLHWGNRGGNFAGTGVGSGDILLDPLFCRPDTLDYRLQACSPAIGAGRDSTDRVLGYQGNAGPFCADRVGPTVSIAFLKNSVVPRFIDVYVNFSEAVIDTSLSFLQICTNQASVPLALTRTDSASSVYGIQGIETSQCGVLQIAVEVSDACGNATVFSRSVSTAVVAPGDSAILKSPDGAAQIEVSGAMTARDAMILLATAPSSEVTPEEDALLATLGRPVGAVYEAIGLGALAGSSLSLAIRLPAEVAAAEAGATALYRRVDTGWAREESWLDAGSRRVVAHPREDALYRLVVTGDPTVSPALPTRLALHPSYPNPAPGAARFAFDLPARAHATLRIFDASGRRITTLVDRSLPQGRHAFGWAGADDDGRRVPSGVYFYELRAGKTTETRKLVLIR